MKHEYADLCQVLDMLNWGNVVKYLPRFNVTQNSVSAPKNAVLGGPTAVAFTHFILLLPAVRKWKSGSEDNRSISLEEAETLGSKTYISGFNCYIIGGRGKKTQSQIGGCSLMVLSDNRLMKAALGSPQVERTCGSGHPPTATALRGATALLLHVQLLQD